MSHSHQITKEVQKKKLALNDINKKQMAERANAMKEEMKRAH